MMDDVIYRKDAIDALDITPLEVHDYELAVGVIKDIPSAQKKGHWIIGDVDEYDLSYGDRIYVPNYKCSCCVRTIESYVRWDEPSMPDDADFPKFCPHCGADMRGEDDV